MIFLVYRITSLFNYVFVLPPVPTWYIILLLWRDIAYLCESAVKPQASKQTNKQTNKQTISEDVWEPVANMQKKRLVNEKYSKRGELMKSW